MSHPDLRPLGISRPVALDLVSRRHVREEVVVIDGVGGEGSAADADGGLGNRVGGSGTAQATHRLSVVLVLIQHHVVVGVLDAHGNEKFLRRVPFVLREGLDGLGFEMLVKIPERRVDPRTGFVGI